MALTYVKEQTPVPPIPASQRQPVQLFWLFLFRVILRLLRDSTFYKESWQTEIDGS